MLKIFSLTPASKTPSKASSSLYKLLIQCNVTPASRGREGIRRVSDKHVYIHVGAEPKKGQANDAVCGVLAEVCSYLFLIYIEYISNQLTFPSHLVDVGPRRSTFGSHCSRQE